MFRRAGGLHTSKSWVRRAAGFAERFTYFEELGSQSRRFRRTSYMLRRAWQFTCFEELGFRYTSSTLSLRKRNRSSSKLYFK